MKIKRTTALLLIFVIIAASMQLAYASVQKAASAPQKTSGFDVDLYTTSTDVQNNKHTSAKYEPTSGIYFGATYDMDPRIKSYLWDKVKNYFPKKNTANLIYLIWGENIKLRDIYYKDAKQNGIAVQIAWNIPDSKIAVTLKNIRSYSGYIEETAKYLGETDIPVFLRFACEMNIKDNSKDSASYIDAFRYVSGVMKQYAPNVAMVWSPNDISAKGRTYEQYYPGDSYVDWVGVSSYNFPYFQGKKDWGKLQEVIDRTYMTGDYANPLAKIKPIIDKYGSRKPIMLSETGVSHYSKLQQEDLTAWAAVQMKRLYIYGPMRYPELKGIYYFNVNNDAVTRRDDYSLYGNDTIYNLYSKLVSDDYFLTGVGQTAPFRYVEITDYKTNEKNIALDTYTIVPKVLKPVVKYKVDSKVIASSDELPYTTRLDASKYSAGSHNLTVEVYDGNKLLKARNYQLVLSDSQIQIISK